MSISAVLEADDCRQNEVELRAPGEANGELGKLLGCVISILSLCISELLCGGDISTELLFNVSTEERMQVE